MATMTFDTLKFTDRLKEAGISDAHARAEAEAIRDALQASELATKTDVTLLRSEMSGEFKLVKWILALVVAVEVMPLMAKLFT